MITPETNTMFEYSMSLKKRLVVNTDATHDF